MKKFFKTILYILSAAALFTVAACGGSTNKTSDDVDIYDGALLLQQDGGETLSPLYRLTVDDDGTVGEVTPVSWNG